MDNMLSVVCNLDTNAACLNVIGLRMVNNGQIGAQNLLLRITVCVA